MAFKWENDMKNWRLPVVLLGMFLVVPLIHIYFVGLTSSVSSEGLGRGVVPSEHYEDIEDLGFKALHALFLYLFTVIGVIFNILWSKSEGGRITNFWTLQTLRPLLVSPIIFYSVYVFASKTPDTTVAMLFSFQSGFFWQAIFTRKVTESVEN
jgi:hypothetical protein